jgi:hypothetical protein
MGDPQESANERRHEQVEAVEEILDSVDPALEEHAYPVTSEELSAHYGSTNSELPNETESLGSVFDRLEDKEYDSPMEVKEAVLRRASAASPDPTIAGSNRNPEPGAQGAPQERADDREAREVAESTQEGTPTDVEAEADDVGTPANTADGPETDAAEPGDQLTPDTTEADEFAPQESVEDRDREGDRRASAERSSDRDDPREDATEDPGDPAEPTAEPTEEELDSEAQGSDLPDPEELTEDADGKASERARREGEDGEPLEGTDVERLGESQVPDARDEEPDVTREGYLPDDEDEDEDDEE